MSEIVLFHSAQGLRPAVHRFADALRADGHTVHTPDLYAGKVFDCLDDGVAERDAIGMPMLMQRVAAAVEGLPTEVFYLGFSMGAASAQWLAATRPGCRGVVLMHGVLPLAALELERWPSIPAQVHYASGDPWVEVDVVEALKAGAPEQFDVHAYDGGTHLFADEDSPDYEAASAAAMLTAVRRFVA